MDENLRRISYNVRIYRIRGMLLKMGLQIFGYEARRDFSTYLYIFFDHVGIRNGYKRQRARRMDVKMGLQIFRHEARRNFSTYLYVF